MVNIDKVRDTLCGIANDVHFSVRIAAVMAACGHRWSGRNRPPHAVEVQGAVGYLCDTMIKNLTDKPDSTHSSCSTGGIAVYYARYGAVEQVQVLYTPECVTRTL